MPRPIGTTPALLAFILSMGTLGDAAAPKDKGGICEPREHYKEVEGDPGAYVQCTPKVAHIGEWELLRCPKGEVFVESSQKCKPASAVRRQQSLCQFQPYAPGCAPVACPVSNANPMLGGGCNWASASLVPQATDPSCFLQCTPVATGAPCGVWNQMACAAGSVFQPQLQVCVTAALPAAACQTGYSPVCPCGPLNLCPGACVCSVGVCCQPVIPVTPVIPVIPVTPPYIVTTPFTLPPTTPPLCPNGMPGGPGTPCVGTGQGTCQLPNYDCMNGACCLMPLPQCPTGQPATQRCIGTGQANCPAGYYCVNGGCCPLPICPNGVPAIQACTGPGTCPSTSYCFNGGCCPIPTCPNGQVASQPCTTTAECPGGFTCQAGGCCPLPLPTCPNGQLATMACTGPGTCPAGYFCQTGPNGEQGCCPVPTCPSGLPAISPCGAAQSCPSGYLCQNNGCCALPPTTMLPTFPFTTPGQYGPVCPPCPAAPCAAPCCPVMTVALCVCAQVNSVCPTGAMCNQGTCCAPTQGPYNNMLKPGDRCNQPTECPGYPQTGQCNNGYCVCIGSSRSNGFTCAVYRRRYDPSESCNQFGTQCKLYGDRHERRRPPSMEEMGIGNETQPLWWHSLNNNCVTDNECTPDMLCIEGKCHHHLRPGDYHCQYDEQCNRTTAGSACVRVPSANMTVCQCEHGRLEFAHKCWRECPAGTRAKGTTCVPHKLEKNGIKAFAKRILSLFTPWTRHQGGTE